MATLWGKAAARSVRWRGRNWTHSVIPPPSIDALRKVYSINLSETSTPRGMQLSSHHGEWGGKPANRPESRIGRPYKTQNDFGFRRSANDSLASRIINFRQYAVPWHGDPRIGGVLGGKWPTSNTVPGNASRPARMPAGDSGQFRSIRSLNQNVFDEHPIFGRCKRKATPHAPHITRGC